MVKITIDGKEVIAKSGEMIIEAADREGIYIPRFCYHKKLSIAANCRMCMVEIANNNHTVPACATPVVDGVSVFTKSTKAVVSQRAILEFLLINHPLDCPVCDQGGECELQDLSVGFGSGESNFDETKRQVADPDIGPLITTNMNRCIHCTRCIRFGEEIAGVKDLGLINRGTDTEVRTYVNATVKSQLSGNLIDICPVGALNSKPYAFQARSWEMSAHAGIAPHDCLGANIFLHVRDNTIFRVVAREHEQLNETWISDRDRFSYLAVQHDDRVVTPMIKVANELQPVSWEQALAVTTEKLLSCQQHPTQLGGIISPSATTQEMFLWQKLLRALGTNNIDHRIRQLDFSDDNCLPDSPAIQYSLTDLVASEVIIIIGADIDAEQPLLSVRLRAAIKRGAKVYVINPLNYEYNFTVVDKVIINEKHLVTGLLNLLSATDNDNTELMAKRNLDYSQQIQELLEVLAQHQNIALISGSHIYQHAASATLREIIRQFTQHYQIKHYPLSHGSNHVGGCAVGAVPYQDASGELLQNPGLNVQQMSVNNLQVYCLFNIEPELDCLTASTLVPALQQADFVIAFTPYLSESMQEYCDVVLPIATFAETPGSYINMFNNEQQFNAAILPMHSARPGWKVLRALGSMLELAGFQYDNIQQVNDEISQQASSSRLSQPYSAIWQTPVNTCLVTWPVYYTDNLVRRSYALQKASDTVGEYVFMNDNTAVKLQLTTADRVTLATNGQIATHGVKIDNRLLDDDWLLQQGVLSNTMLEINKIEIKKC